MNHVLNSCNLIFLKHFTIFPAVTDVRKKFIVIQFTVYPRSNDLSYIVGYYTECVTTSWTNYTSVLFLIFMFSTKTKLCNELTKFNCEILRNYSENKEWGWRFLLESCANVTINKNKKFQANCIRYFFLAEKGAKFLL